MEIQYKEISGFDLMYIIYENELFEIKKSNINPVKIYSTKNNKNVVYLIKDKKSHIYNLNKLLNKNCDYIINKKIKFNTYDKNC